MIKIKFVQFFVAALAFCCIAATKIDDDLCDEQLSALTEALQDMELWALKLVNSWGSSNPLFFSGEHLFYGKFTECLKYNEDTIVAGAVEGKYCYLTRTVNLNDTLYFNIGSGICVPASCSEQKVFNVVLGLQKSLPSQLDELPLHVRCQTKDPVPLNWVDLAALSMISVLGTLVVLSTTYDVLSRRRTTAEVNKMLLAFSLYSNAKLLFKVRRDTSSKSIDCLDGIRCISTIFIILGHRFALQTRNMSNPTEYVEFQKSYAFVAFMWAHLCVVTFMTMGGFLCALQMLSALERKVFSPLKLYLHRYLRYTPPLAASILCFVSIFQHMKAPNLAETQQTVDDCKNYWWSLLLHVQNYVNPRHVCTQHIWYLSADFQLYVLSPILIYPAFKYGWKYLWFLPALALAASIYTVKLCLDIDFMYKDLTAPKFLDQVHFKTHVRLPAWLIGMTFGYIVHKIKGKEVKVNKHLDSLLWALSIGLIAFCIASFYPFIQNADNETTVMQNAIFQALQPILWPLPFCWIIFACFKLKSGGVVRWFLSLPEWQPMGRISMAMYIIHFLYEHLHVSSDMETHTFSVIYVMKTFMGDLMVTLLLSVVLVLVVEMPICTLEGLLWKKTASKSKSKRKENPEQLEIDRNKSAGIVNPTFIAVDSERC